MGNHQLIHTVSEPWVLLPLYDLVDNHGSFSDYGRRNTSLALTDLYQHLPGGYDDIYQNIESFYRSMYTQICLNEKKSARHFLDKTPRYHLVIDKIHHTFPDAKFIYLFRNPLSVVSSMLMTEPENVWSLYFFNVDLYKGLENLIHYQNVFADSSITMQYEDLLNSPAKEMNRLFEYLEIDVGDFSINLKSNPFLSGHMGDQTGPNKETQLDQHSLSKWKKVLNNPVRRSWCRCYIKWIGEERLDAMGYKMASLLKSLDELDVSLDGRSFQDIYRILFGIFYTNFELTMLKENFQNLRHLYKTSAKT